MDILIRKFHSTLDEIFHEGGPRTARPLRRAALLAVIHNPYAGRYEPDILPMMESLNGLGVEMAGRLVTLLGGDPKAVEGYGKGAIVGAAGELEHGALWHVPGGYAMRRVLGEAKAIVPSAKKVGGPGARLDVPVTVEVGALSSGDVAAALVAGRARAMEYARAGLILAAMLQLRGERRIVSADGYPHPQVSFHP